MTPEVSPAESESSARFSTALGIGAIAVLLVPGLSSLGAPAYVPDESWRRPIALALLALGAFVGPFARGRLPSPRGVLLAALALTPAITAALRLNASAYEASSAPVFVALAATVLLASTVGAVRGSGYILDSLGCAGLVASIWVLVDALCARVAVGPFGRGGVAGPALSALLVPAALLGRHLPRTARGGLRAIPALVVAVALLLTRSRTGIVAGALAAGVATIGFVPSGRRRRTTVIVASLAFVGTVFAILASCHVLPGGDTLRVRVGLARASIALVEESPWLGHGPNGFARDVNPVRDLEEAMLSSGGRPLAAHNDLLHVAAENGIPAALAIGLLMLLSIRRPPRGGSPIAPDRSRVATTELAIVVATIASSVSENPLLSIATSVPFGLAAGLASARASGPVAARSVLAATSARLGFTAVLAWFAFATFEIPLAGDRVLANWLGEHGIDAGDPDRMAAANAALRTAASGRRAEVHGPLLYQVAAGFASEGRSDEAWRAYNRLLEVDPGATEARLDVAELHRRAGRIDDAKDVLRRARELDPTRFDVPLRLGHLTLGDEPVLDPAALPADPLAVLRLYDDAIALDGKRFEGAVALARFHRRMGDLPSARRELARAKELGGLRGEVLLESFRIAVAEGAPETATTSILALALAASPSLAAEIGREVQTLLDAGDAEERRALEAAAAARSGADMTEADARYAAALLRRSATLAAGLVSRAVLRVEAAAAAASGRHRRALVTYRAILSDPFAIEDPRTAFAASSSAARFDAALSDALSARGRTLQGFDELGTDDLPAAERDFRAAIQKTPGLAAAHYGLARVLARAGGDVEAVAELTRAMALDPDVRRRAAVEPDLATARTKIPPPTGK